MRMTEKIEKKTGKGTGRIRISSTQTVPSRTSYTIYRMQKNAACFSDRDFKDNNNIKLWQ
jgi:hypothetical protein